MRQIVVQLTDLHVKVGEGDVAPAAAVAAVVDAVVALDPAPVAVLVTGDLTDHGTGVEYARVRELLAPLTMPVYPVPGNHDDRDELCSSFVDVQAVADCDGGYLQYVVPIGSLDVVMVDTLDSGFAGGRLGRERLDWIGGALAACRGRSILIAMHHPPVLSGIDALDSIALAEGDRAALGELVSGEPRVDRIVGGHLHRAFTTLLGGVPVFACPGVYEQTVLDLRAGGGLKLFERPPSFGVHVHGVGRHIVSHVETVFGA